MGKGRSNRGIERIGVEKKIGSQILGLPIFSSVDMDFESILQGYSY
jgi:hypothetical protein